MMFSWQVFIPIALLLGDGLYSFVKITGITLINLYARFKNRKQSLGIKDQVFFKLHIYIIYIYMYVLFNFCVFFLVKKFQGRKQMIMVMRKHWMKYL